MTELPRAFLARFHAGTLTFEELVRACRTYPWRKRPTPDRSYAAVVQAEESDPEPILAGSWDDVSVAYTLGWLTDDQYAALVDAVSDQFTKPTSEDA